MKAKFLLMSLMLCWGACDGPSVTVEAQRQRLQEERRLQQKDTKNINLRLRLAKKFLNEGKPLEARLHLREGLLDYPNQPQLQYQIALIDIRLEEFEKAEKALMQLKANAELESQVLLGLTFSKARQGKYLEALGELEKIQMLNRTGPEAVQLLHQQYYLHRNRFELKSQLKVAGQALALDPENALNSALLVIAYLDGMTFQPDLLPKATKVVKEMRAGQKTATVELVTAIHQVARQQYSRAQKTLAAIKTQQLPTELLFAAGQTAYRLSAQPVLEAITDRYATSVGDSPELVLLKAYRSMKNQLIESLTLLRAGRKFYPEDPRFLLALSQAHRVKGENELSVLRLQEAAALVPNAPSLQLKAVQELMNAGAPLMAQKILIDLLDRTPKNVEAQYAMAELHAKMGQLEEMDAVFSRLKSGHAPCRYGWILTVRTFQDPSRVQKGIKQLQKCIKRYPKHPTAHRTLADAFAGLALHGQAKKHYLKHLRLPGEEADYERIRAYLRKTGVRAKSIPRKEGSP